MSSSKEREKLAEGKKITLFLQDFCSKGAKKH